jgi:choline-sulfatase
MTSRPNVVVMMADQHSPSVLGCAGAPVRTPNLDRLAAGGVRFTSAYAGSPLCVPSRATFMTGQQCSEIGVWSNSCTFGSDIPTFAHSLATAGYDTVLCGRMHFKGADQRHGFTARIHGDVTGPADGQPQTLLGATPWASQGQGRDGVAIAGPGRTGFQAFDTGVTEAAARFIDERGAGSARPFCLVVGWVLPHNPYIAPAPLFEEYLDRVRVPVVRAGCWEAQHPAVQRWRGSRGTDEVSADEARVALAAYYGLVTRVDEQVGKIMAALERTTLKQETAVFYTSDHGDMLGEQGLWQKSYLYEASVGVPLIASRPGQFAAGAVIETPVSLVDMAPTLIDLGGGPELPHTSGRVLTPALRGQPLPSNMHPEVYAESMHVAGFPPARMVRRGPWKLVQYHGYEQPQLFNLVDDPDELHDLGGDPGVAVVREELSALVLNGWSGEAVERAVARRVDDALLLGAWAQAVRPVQADLWKAPEGSNVFPEH